MQISPNTFRAIRTHSESPPPPALIPCCCIYLQRAVRKALGRQNKQIECYSLAWPTNNNNNNSNINSIVDWWGSLLLSPRMKYNHYLLMFYCILEFIWVPLKFNTDTMIAVVRGSSRGEKISTAASEQLM